MHIAVLWAINDHFFYAEVSQNRFHFNYPVCFGFQQIPAGLDLVLRIQVELTFHQVMQLSLLKHWIVFKCTPANMLTAEPTSLANRAVQAR